MLWERIIQDNLINSPTVGSTLSGASETFSWNDNGTGASSYMLQIGSTVGGWDIYNNSLGAALSADVSGLPTNGSTVYVRFSYFPGGSWVSINYTYTAFNGGM